MGQQIANLAEKEGYFEHCQNSTSDVWTRELRILLGILRFTMLLLRHEYCILSAKEAEITSKRVKVA